VFTDSYRHTNLRKYPHLKTDTHTRKRDILYDVPGILEEDCTVLWFVSLVCASVQKQKKLRNGKHCVAR